MPRAKRLQARRHAQPSGIRALAWYARQQRGRPGGVALLFGQAHNITARLPASGEAAISQDYGVMAIRRALPVVHLMMEYASRVW